MNRLGIDSPSYVLQKYEPKELYIGNWLDADPRVNNVWKPAYSTNEYTNFINKFEQTLVGGLGAHSSYIKYFGYKQGDIQNLKNWIQACHNKDILPQFCLEPNNGLDEVLDDEYLTALAKILGGFKKPILLRYASEMNGSWTVWSGNPAQYISKWKIVYNAMKNNAPNVIMGWCPNDAPASKIDLYYPGDEYVDWVGLNVYNSLYINNNPLQNTYNKDLFECIDYVYEKYSSKKPIFIGEWAIANATSTDNFIDHSTLAIDCMKKFYRLIADKYPRLKLMSYFNGDKSEIISSGAKTDYSITKTLKMANGYKSATFNLKNRFDVVNNQGSKSIQELITKSPIVNKNERPYLVARDICNTLNGTLHNQNNILTLNINGSKINMSVDGISAYVEDGKTYIDAREFANLAGYVFIRCSSDYCKLQYSKIRYVTENVTVYASADGKSQKLGTIPYGSMIFMTEITSEIFIKVKFNGIEGYILRHYVVNGAITRCMDITVAENHTVFSSNNSSSTPLGTIKAGVKIRYKKTFDAHFMQIDFNGKLGYVLTKNVTSIEKSLRRYNDKEIELRYLPSDDSRIITLIPPNSPLELVEYGQTFVKVKYFDRYGYINRYVLYA